MGESGESQVLKILIREAGAFKNPENGDELSEEIHSTFMRLRRHIISLRRKTQRENNYVGLAKLYNHEKRTPCKVQYFFIFKDAMFSTLVMNFLCSLPGGADVSTPWDSQNFLKKY